MLLFVLLLLLLFVLLSLLLATDTVVNAGATTIAAAVLTTAVWHSLLSYALHSFVSCDRICMLLRTLVIAVMGASLCNPRLLFTAHTPHGLCNRSYSRTEVSFNCPSRATQMGLSSASCLGSPGPKPPRHLHLRPPCGPLMSFFPNPIVSPSMTSSY